LTGSLEPTPESGKSSKTGTPKYVGKAALLKLKPVTFRYKHELDPDGIPQFGLVAEEVEKVNPDLVVRGEDGKVMTVRYEAVNAVLLNEFLKNIAKSRSMSVTRWTSNQLSPRSKQRWPSSRSRLKLSLQLCRR